MSLPGTRWAWRCAIPSTEKIVLLYLADLCNHRNECWCAQRTVAHATGLGTSTVKRVLRWLETQGFITVIRRERRPGIQGSNIYRLHIEGRVTDDSGRPVRSRSETSKVSERDLEGLGASREGARCEPPMVSERDPDPSIDPKKGSGSTGEPAARGMDPDPSDEQPLEPQPDECPFLASVRPGDADLSDWLEWTHKMAWRWGDELPEALRSPDSAIQVLGRISRRRLVGIAWAVCKAQRPPPVWQVKEWAA